jgi:hypothetical protein
MLQPRNPHLSVTEEMLGLFERGLELVEQGHDQREFDHEHGCPGCDEYRALTKRLEWKLIQLEPHCASVFDPAVDGPPPERTGIYAIVVDWPIVQAWRRALMAALEARKKTRLQNGESQRRGQRDAGEGCPGPE